MTTEIRIPIPELAPLLAQKPREPGKSFVSSPEQAALQQATIAAEHSPKPATIIPGLDGQVVAGREQELRGVPGRIAPEIGAGGGAK